MSEYQETIIEPGDRLSKIAAEVNRATYRNHPAVTVLDHKKGFRGAVNFALGSEVLAQQAGRVTNLTLQNDGAGGKPQFFTLLGNPAAFAGLGHEIVAMCADDVAVCGDLPLVMMNQIDTKAVTEENFPLAEAMVRGYGDAMQACRLVNLTGETAIMQQSITAFCDTGNKEQLVLTWSGGCFGLAAYDAYDHFSLATQNMSVIGFHEPGYGCNGGTALTKLIMRRFGTDWEALRENERYMDFLSAITIPSRSFAGTLARLNGWREDGTLGDPLVPLFGMAHITGGGIMKLKEALPPGIGANLHDMPEPQRVLQLAQQLSGETEAPFTDHEMHTTFNGGCRLYVICFAEDAERVLEEAAKDGHVARVVGYTFATDNKETVIVHSRFRERRVLRF